MAAVLLKMLEAREHPTMTGYRLQQGQRYLVAPDAAATLIESKAAKAHVGEAGLFMPGVRDTSKLATELLELEVAAGLRDEMPATIRVRGRPDVRYQPPKQAEPEPIAEPSAEEPS